MTPQMAVVMRQPTGFAWPNICMPRAMSHLPVGGWTAYEAVAESPDVLPAAKVGS